MKTLLALPILALGLAAQALDPAVLNKPLANDWPTYSGDYSGQRYSRLTQINQANVKNLSLAWTARVANGPGGGGGFGGGRGGFNAGPPLIVGGEGSGEAAGGFGGGTSIKASILAVEGILYLSTPDNAWAVDARDGRVLWHYFWKTKGGTHIGNRGLGMWGKWLYIGDAGRLSGVPGRADWQRALAQADRRFQSPVFLHHGAHRDRQSHHRGHGQRS